MTIGIDPVAFTIGSLEIRWYGIMMFLAVLAVILWVAREIRNGAKISPDDLLMMAVIGVIFGIMFARLFHVIDLWEYYSQHPSEIVGGAGLSAYGGILGATLAIWVYTKISKLNFGYIVDTVAPAIPLAQAIGRIGCTLNGCCYGVETSLPCGVIYTHPNSYAVLGVAVHPTQIYEIIFSLIVFAVLMFLRGRLNKNGSLFLIWLICYSSWRLGSDFLRDGTPFLFGLHQAQVIAIVVLLIAIPLLIIKLRSTKVEEEA